jgi:hypothetical protein
MIIDTSREAIDRMTGMWGVGVEPNMARVTEVLTALTRERDEALADIARIQEERAEFVAGVEALAGVLKGERDEALAREAVLREAAEYVQRDLTVRADPMGRVPIGAGAWDGLNAALTSTATAAEARDAALIEQGRREGIEEARMAAYDLARDYAGYDGEAEAVALEKLAFQLKRALATPPDGGPR